MAFYYSKLSFMISPAGLRSYLIVQFVVYANSDFNLNKRLEREARRIECQQELTLYLFYCFLN